MVCCDEREDIMKYTDTLIRRDERGAVTGFIQFTVMDLESWFFTV